MQLQWCEPYVHTRNLSSHYSSYPGALSIPRLLAARCPWRALRGLRRGKRPTGGRARKQPRHNSRISNAEAKSYGTMPPRLFAVTWSPPRYREIRSTSRFCPVIMVVAGDRKAFDGYLVGGSTKLQPIARAPLAQFGAPASSSLSFLASFSEPLGPRRWRRLLRFCPRPANRTQSRFHQRLSTCQRKLPRPAPRRK